MPFFNSLRSLISSLFTKKPTPEPLQGSQYPISIASTSQGRQNLDIPETPVRPINDLETSRKLIEVYCWSYEAVHSYDFLARDAFQQQDGSSGSWTVADKLADSTPVNPIVKAIALDLQYRTDGDDLIVGGDVLQAAAREALGYGDSFLQVSWEKEGISRGEYGINRSVFMPPLSMFVERSEQGELLAYRQQRSLFKQPTDIVFNPHKIFQFSYKKRKGQRYGTSIIMQSLPAWDNVQDAAFALAKAARDLGVSPWLHIMAEGRTQQDLNNYRDSHQNALAQNIVTNLYLAHGGDVRKAGMDVNAIAPLAEYFLACRRRMIPPGVPTWLFPDLASEAGMGKDLNGQPALAYARTVANLRSLVGHQIKRIIGLEIFLRRGPEFYQEYGQKFDITWGKWLTSTLEAAMDGEKEKKKTATEGGDE